MNIIKIVDVESGLESEREMNEDELAQLEADKAETEARAQVVLIAEEQARLEAEAKAATKAAALAKLGLTEEEINAFLA
jgi:hypothetical protein